MAKRVVAGFPMTSLAILAAIPLLASLSGCLDKPIGSPLVTTESTITLHGRILTIIDQPAMLLLAVDTNHKAEGRLLRHAALIQDLYVGDMAVAVVSADCWRKNTLGEVGDFCLAETLTKIDESDAGTLEQAAPEEVSTEEFRAALAGKSPDVVILDVRNREETAKGVFKNAVSIPLEQLAARHNELPKNKEIFVHCALGGRAKMAAYELNRLGFHARFFPLDVSSSKCACPFDGK